MRARIALLTTLLMFAIACKPRQDQLSQTLENNQKFPNNGSLIFGGGTLEDPAIYHELLRLAQRSSTLTRPKIAVLFSGSPAYPDIAQYFYKSGTDENGNALDKSFKELLEQYGFEPVLIPLNLDTFRSKSYFPDVPFSNVANDPKWAKTVEECSAIYLGGGDQARHFRTLKNDDNSDSAILKSIRSVLQRGGVIIGTSAGAMVMTEFIFGGGNSFGYIRKNRLKHLTLKDQLAEVRYDRSAQPPSQGATRDQEGFWLHPVSKERYDISPKMQTPELEAVGAGSLGYGLNFVQGLLVDTHAEQRGRLGRMIVASAQGDINKNAPVRAGVAVDANTVFVLDIASMSGKAIGEFGVFIADHTGAKIGSNVDNTFKEIGVHIHYLTNGDTIDLRTPGNFIVTSTKAAANGGFGLQNTVASTPYLGDMFEYFGATKIFLDAIRRGSELARGKARNLQPGTTNDPREFSITLRRAAGKTKTFIEGDKFSIENYLLDIN